MVGSPSQVGAAAAMQFFHFYLKRQRPLLCGVKENCCFHQTWENPSEPYGIFAAFTFSHFFKKSSFSPLSKNKFAIKAQNPHITIPSWVQANHQHFNSCFSSQVWCLVSDWTPGEPPKERELYEPFAPWATRCTVGLTVGNGWDDRVHNLL